MKRLLILFSLIIIVSQAYATEISTKYNRGTFHTRTTNIIDADFQTCSKTIDDFIYEFPTDPELLFSWAFKGTGQTKNDDGSDDVVLIMNYVKYDPDSSKSLINADFEMSNGFAIRNKDLMSYVYDQHPNSIERDITVDFYYSGSLLNKANGKFELIEIDQTHTSVALNIDIKFGWFFNMFITQKRYRNVIEWRVRQFVDNLSEESNWRQNGDLRQHTTIKTK